MRPVPNVDAPAAIFGQIKGILPAWDEIPEQFWKHHNPYARVVSKLFFSGGALSDFGLTVKPGLDKANVMRAVNACLSSFEPNHEHKEAGVAFLLSEWFDGEPKV